MSGSTYCGKPSPNGYFYTTALHPQLQKDTGARTRGVCDEMGPLRNDRTNKTGTVAISVCILTWKEGSVNGSHLQTKNYVQIVTAGQGELTAPRDELPNCFSVTKWSYTQITKIDPACCIHVFVHKHTHIHICNMNKENMLLIREQGTWEMLKGGKGRKRRERLII